MCVCVMGAGGLVEAWKKFLTCLYEEEEVFHVYVVSCFNLKSIKSDL